MKDCSTEKQSCLWEEGLLKNGLEKAVLPLVSGPRDGTGHLSNGCTNTWGIALCAWVFESMINTWWVWILSIPYNTFSNLQVILYFCWFGIVSRMRVNRGNGIFVFWFHFILLTFKYSMLRIGSIEFIITIWVVWEMLLKALSILHKHIGTLVSLL